MMTSGEIIWKARSPIIQSGRGIGSATARRRPGGEEHGAERADDGELQPVPEIGGKAGIASTPM